MARQKPERDFILQQIRESLAEIDSRLEKIEGGRTPLPTEERLILATRTILSLSRATTPNLHVTTKQIIHNAIKEVINTILFEFKPQIVSTHNYADLSKETENLINGFTTDG